MAIIIIIMFGFCETVVIMMHRLVHWQTALYVQSANVGTKLDRWCYWWMHKANLCGYHFWCCIYFSFFFNGFNFKRNNTDIFFMIRLMHSGRVRWTTYIDWNGIATKKSTNNEFDMKIKPQNDDNHQQCARFLIQYRYGYCFKWYALNASGPSQAKPSNIAKMRRKKFWIWIECKLHWVEYWVLSNACNKLRAISMCCGSCISHY